MAMRGKKSLDRKADGIAEQSSKGRELEMVEQKHCKAAAE
jgi:hypothetical protein